MASLLRAVPLFTELSDEDIQRLEQRAEPITLEVGEVLVTEGEVGHSAFVIVDGEIEILKSVGTRDVLLAVRKPGDVIGEMSLLQDVPRSATARARTPSTLLSIPKAEIDALMETSAGAIRALFRVLRERWQSTQAMLTQSQRMAQLGTLTAGLAHEMNNPAAAVNRGVEQLRAAVTQLVRAERRLWGAVDPAQVDAIEALRDALAGTERVGDRLTPIERSDLEDAVEDSLAAAGVPDGWRVAPVVVESGLAAHIGEIVAVAGPRSGALFEVLCAEHEVADLLYEVEEGTRRLSAIVKALKSYSYLDQAPVQEVDILAGIEDTLLILKSKLTGIDVRRQYAEEFPRIQAFGSELNQVWTNLLDNAADAIHGVEGHRGVITIRAVHTADHVVVEVEDNGPGIPPDVVDQIFDSFFTTKPPGAGTGIGLHTSYTIVVDKHRGDLRVTSEPGRTVFRVELPRTVPETDG